MSRRIVARVVADLRPELEGLRGPAAFGVGYDGSIYAAAHESDEPTSDEVAGWATFPKSRLTAATDYRVLRWHEGHAERIRVSSALVVSHVQPTPEGILLVSARCRWRPGNVERNALLVDRSGGTLRELTLGDGIEDLRVSRDGTIWVSYFDEGVFGNSMGAAGLVAFGPRGDVCFTYDPSAARTGSIADAYAMNVTPNGDVWLYFYTEFPIVRIAGGQYQKWSFGVGGARGLAVRDDRVLLVGDYERRHMARVVQLADRGAAHLIEEVTVVDEHGAPIEGARMFGTGAAVHMFKDNQVRVIADW